MIINGPNISKNDSQTWRASWGRYTLPLQKYSRKKQNKVTTKNIRINKQTKNTLDIIVTLELTSKLEETQKAEENGQYRHTDAIRKFQVWAFYRMDFFNK